MDKPRIGMLGLTLDEYDRLGLDEKQEREQFGRLLAETLCPIAEVDFPGAASTRTECEEQLAGFAACDYDAVMVVFLTYAPSLIAAPGLLRSSLPIVIWNTQPDAAIQLDTPGSFTMANHGVHGVQDLANVLRRSSVPFLVTTGHYQQPQALERLRDSLYAAKAVSALRRARIGLLGHAMQDMGDFGVDTTALLCQIGPSVVHLDVNCLAELVQQAPDETVTAMVAADREQYVWDPAITAEEALASARMEWAVRELVRDFQLDGWAQHFLTLGQHKQIHTLPFMAASRLMAEGIGFGAEGDVTAVAAFLLVRCLVGEANFTEMFSMDLADGSVLMRHMGEANVAMQRPNTPLYIARNRFDLVDVLPIPTPVFAFREGPAALVSLTTGQHGRLQLVTAEGSVTSFPGRQAAVSAEFKWRPALPLEPFLDRYAYAGGSHHQAMGYGCRASAVVQAARLLDIDVCCLDAGLDQKGGTANEGSAAGSS